jgi:hypothetical protein
MIVKTLGSACPPLDILWQKGRQADKMCTCSRCLPTFWAAWSNFLSLTMAICYKKFHMWAKPILVVCSKKKHVTIKHVRSASRVALTCPPGPFLFFEDVSQLGEECFLFFWRGGSLISHQVPINIPSTSCSHQVFISFPSNTSCSHQNSFVLINL